MDRRKFVQASGIYMLLFPLSKTLGIYNFSEGAEQDYQLKRKCIAAFNRFSEVWEFHDFWKRGNTMDACLNFTNALSDKWPHSPEIKSIRQKVDVMLEKDYAYFNSINPQKLWADDYGWWGLMGLSARKHLVRSNKKELADKYFKLSTDLCWKQARNHAYDFTDAAKPVHHGWRNGDTAGKNQGVKNTVTNVLYFLLSARIYRTMEQEYIGNSEEYLEMAYYQWLWFDNWFQLKQYEYLKKTMAGGALVQERPTAFFKGSDYTDIEHPTWEKGWLWTGDQGMLLAALTDMIAIKGSLKSWLIKNRINEEFDENAFEKKIRQLYT